MHFGQNVWVRLRTSFLAASTTNDDSTLHAFRTKRMGSTSNIIFIYGTRLAVGLDVVRNACRIRWQFVRLSFDGRAQRVKSQENHSASCVVCHPPRVCQPVLRGTCFAEYNANAEKFGDLVLMRTSRKKRSLNAIDFLILLPALFLF
jgi:hypothetical protein